MREVAQLVLSSPRGSTSASAVATAASQKGTEKGKSARKGDKEKESEVDKDSTNAKYYATITLNQITLLPSAAGSKVAEGGADDRAVARQLVSVYFELFTGVVLARSVSEQQRGPKSEKEDAEGETEKVKGRTEMRKDKMRKKSREGNLEKGPFAEISDGSERLVSAILTGLHRALPYAYGNSSQSSDSSDDGADVLVKPFFLCFEADEDEQL